MTSHSQAVALALLPKLMGWVSCAGSSVLAVSVLRNPKKRSRSYHRLILGISLVDVLVSFFLALSTWPMPSDSGLLWAVGNETTCSMQGFFVQMYVVSSFYSVSLAVYYTVVLRYNWNEERVRRLEPYLHTLPMLWGVGTGIIGIPLKLYNNAGVWCWIAPFPAGCVGEDCIRGRDANFYRWLLFYGPLWVNISFVTISMCMVWLSVRRGTNTSNTNKEGSDTAAFLDKGDERAAERERLTRKVKKDVALQGFLYAGAFYLTWVWFTIVRFLPLIGEPVPYQLLATAVFFAPFQGFLNMLIYLFPKFMALKRTHPEDGLLRWIRDSLQS